MSKQVYISADYSEGSGDRDVVTELNKWGSDNLHKVDFIDMAKVASGSVSKSSDCRICDLKDEFNRQINASSAVIIVIGDKTADRTAGSACLRATLSQSKCTCTPYKQNAKGIQPCKMYVLPSSGNDVNPVNEYSYLRHEFEQAQKRGKPIIVVYNSLYRQSAWLPSYMSGYASSAQPFWMRDSFDRKVGNYALIKGVLGYA